METKPIQQKQQSQPVRQKQHFGIKRFQLKDQSLSFNQRMAEKKKYTPLDFLTDLEHEFRHLS